MNQKSSLKTSLCLSFVFSLLAGCSSGGETEAHDVSQADEPMSEATGGAMQGPGTGGMAAGSGGSETAPGTGGQGSPSPGGLAAAYADYFPIGAAIETSHLQTVGNILATEFNRLTAENAMKWGIIHPTEGNYSWAGADALADYARQNGYSMTGHTFLWHRQTPAWVVSGNVQDVKARLRTHIGEMVNRYGDVVDNWDVVNEAISDDGHSFRTGPEVYGGADWFSTFGSEDYVYWAFKYAEEALEAREPGSAAGKLYYNDYNVTLKDDAILALLDAVREKGARVDGVGLQAHVSLNWPTVSDLRSTINKFVAAGYAVKISELDVTVYDDYPAGVFDPAPEIPYSDTLAAEQAARYAELFSLFREYAQHITSVTLWGVSDAHTWLDHEPVNGRKNYPLLFDASGQPKQAYHSILNF